MNNHIKSNKDRALSLLESVLKIKEDNIISSKEATQGWTNTSFIFEIKNNKNFLVRIGAQDKLINRQTEKIAHEIFKTKKDYKIYYFNQKNGDMVRDFIGKEFPKKRSKDYEEYIKKVGKEISLIHKIKPQSSTIEKHDFLCYKDYKIKISKKYQERYLQLLTKYKNDKQCYCHNDLSPWNVVCKNGKICFIDLEWSRINDHYYDLANFIKVTKIYNTKLQNSFLKAYSNKINEQKLKDFLYIAAFFAYQWTYAMKEYKHLMKYRKQSLKEIKKFYSTHLLSKTFI